MNTNIINAGIAGLNADRLSYVVGKAKSLILGIEGEQNVIATRVQENQNSAKELKALEQLDVTYTSIVGGTAPANPNVNQAAILKAIEEMQNQRSEVVTAKAKNLTEVIAARQEQIKKGEERIANYRKDLAALEVTEVKAEAIVG